MTVTELWSNHGFPCVSPVRVKTVLGHDFTLTASILKWRDGPREYYAKWNKPARERQMPLWSHLYVESKEQNRNRGIDTWNRLTAVRGERGWGWMRKVKGLNKKYMHPDVHCSIFCNSQDLQTAQGPINRWVDIKAVVHLHNGVLLANKGKKEKKGKEKEKRNLTLCNSMNASRDYYAEWNKSVGERQIPYILTYIWNLMNKINWWQNRNRGMDTGNRLTRLNSCQGGGWYGTGWKNVKGLRKKTCI